MARSKSLSQSEYFFNFLFDSNTSKKLIRFNLINCSDIHLRAIIEIFHNLLTNNYLKIPPSFKKIIQKNQVVLQRFISVTKSFSLQRKIIRRHYKAVFHILIKARQIILSALNK